MQQRETDMRRWMGLAATAGAIASAGAAHAATLDIRNAALRVVVIPEARTDVSVTVVRTNPKLPLTVYNAPSGAVVVDGGLSPFWFLGGRPVSCGPSGPGGWMSVWGVGRVAYEDLPEVVARVPMDARVRSSAAVFGAISQADRVDLDSSNCGEWVVGDVRDRLAVRTSGSARVRTGNAGQMALSVSGSGRVATRAAANGLDADVSGSGGVRVEQASGPIRADISGSGGIEIAGGHATSLATRTSGSGDLVFAGVVQDAKGDISGSGDVRVAQVEQSLDAGISGGGRMEVGQAAGTLRARLSGSGSLHIDGGHASAIDAEISGSGGVAFDGVADRVAARTSGSGNLRVGQVLGAVDSRSSGSGRVVIANR
jgi:hypothetical protein